jgi:hypothetical protein
VGGNCCNQAFTLKTLLNECNRDFSPTAKKPGTRSSLESAAFLHFPNPELATIPDTPGCLAAPNLVQGSCLGGQDQMYNEWRFRNRTGEFQR